jgi:hypothetical protein
MCATQQIGNQVITATFSFHTPTIKDSTKGAFGHPSKKSSSQTGKFQRNVKLLIH